MRFFKKIQSVFIRPEQDLLANNKFVFNVNKYPLLIIIKFILLSYIYKKCKIK
jgi:hypothetical protein